MQVEIFFKDGPLDKLMVIYGQRLLKTTQLAEGELFCMMNKNTQEYHYYRLHTRGQARIPDYYKYLGARSYKMTLMEAIQEFGPTS